MAETADPSLLSRTSSGRSGGRVQDLELAFPRDEQDAAAVLVD
jgi:hypothetical protein